MGSKERAEAPEVGVNVCIFPGLSVTDEVLVFADGQPVRATEDYPYRCCREENVPEAVDQDGES
jgi:hypothetical protein